MKKNNNLIKVILILLVLGITIFYLYSYIKEEDKTYKYYDDFTRADIVMTLSFNKDFQFYTTRYVQMFNGDKKISKGELIKNFADYHFIPILDYLNKTTEDTGIIESFQELLSFWTNFNVATIIQRENILVRQDNGKYYTYDKDSRAYTYKIKEKVIGEKGFKETYKAYLNSKNYDKVVDNFINQLYECDSIKKKYGYNQLRNEVINNYQEFYNDNEKIILMVIANDLWGYAKYLKEEYIEWTEDNNKIILLKDISVEEIELEFNFIEFDRIYHPSSKYYTHIYKLDIDNVWSQLEKMGYPKIYS